MRQQLGRIAFRNQHVVVVENQQGSPRQPGCHVERPGAAIGQVRRRRRVRPFHPRREGGAHPGNSVLLHHHAFKGDSGLGRNGLQRGQQMGQPFPAAVSDQEGDIRNGSGGLRFGAVPADLVRPHLVRRGLQANWVRLQGPPQKPSADRRIHIAEMQAAREFPVAADAGAGRIWFNPIRPVAQVGPVLPRDPGTQEARPVQNTGAQPFLDREGSHGPGPPGPGRPP